MAKISISMDDDLYKRVRREAGEEGVSAWLAVAATKHLRSTAMREFAEEMAEASGGPITEEEKEWARKILFWYSTPEP